MEWTASGLPPNQQTEPEEETQGGTDNLPGSLPYSKGYYSLISCSPFLVSLLLTVWRVHAQEPGPAKVAVTGSGIPEAEKVPDSSSIIWQEELSQREAEGAAVWASADLPSGSPLPPAGKEEWQIYIEELCIVFIK